MAKSKALALPESRQALPARLKKKFGATLYKRLAEQEHHTEKSYQRGLVHFASWLEAEGLIELTEAPAARTPERSAWDEDTAMQGLSCLFAFPSNEANLLVETYLRDLLYPPKGQKAYARGSVFSRLAALKWAAREMNRNGGISWLLVAKMPRPEKDKRGRLKEAPGRDMRGPTRAEAKRLLTSASKDEDPRAPLILSMCRYEGYREHELRQIDLKDIDFKKGKVSLVRKKRDEAKWYPLSKQTMEAIKAWLKMRGEKAGPLLTGGPRGKNTKSSIGAATVWRIVQRVGEAAGISGMSPHKIRHRACTDILDEGLRSGWPEEDILFLTGHSSRAALKPYYETLKSIKSGRDLLSSLGGLEDDD